MADTPTQLFGYSVKFHVEVEFPDLDWPNLELPCLPSVGENIPLVIGVPSLEPVLDAINAVHLNYGRWPEPVRTAPAELQEQLEAERTRREELERAILDHKHYSAPRRNTAIDHRLWRHVDPQTTETVPYA